MQFLRGNLNLKRQIFKLFFMVVMVTKLNREIFSRIGLLNIYIYMLYLLRTFTHVFNIKKFEIFLIIK